MDKERLPQWAWLLLGLFAVAILTNVLYIAILGPVGLPEPYLVVLLIASMSLTVIYLGLWYNEERADYWDRPRAAMAGDIFFVVLTALTMAGIVVAMGIEYGLSQLPRELLAMVVGFVSAWALFYFRNTELYDFGS